MTPGPTRSLVALLVAGLVAQAGCETDVIDDAGFQLWCGVELCEWELLEGEIERVSTWHERDYAVSLVSYPVVLAQEAKRVESSLCIAVTSRIEPRAMVYVELDADGDGRIDWSVLVPPSDAFRYSSWDAPTLGDDGVVYVRKVGNGEAVIARLRASEECQERYRVVD